jgi:hypothetical protein
MLLPHVLAEHIESGLEPFTVELPYRVHSVLDAFTGDESLSEKDEWIHALRFLFDERDGKFIFCVEA